METLLLVTVLAGTLALLGFSAVLLRRVSAASQVDVKTEVAAQLERFNSVLGQKISISTADMASRLEQTKGDLRQQVTDRIQQGLSESRSSGEQQLAAGRDEQERLDTDQIRCQRAQPLICAVSPTVFDGDVPILDVTRFAQASVERRQLLRERITRRAVEKADERYSLDWRRRDERRCCQPCPNKSDKSPPLHGFARNPELGDTSGPLARMSCVPCRMCDLPHTPVGDPSSPRWRPAD